MPPQMTVVNEHVTAAILSDLEPAIICPRSTRERHCRSAPSRIGILASWPPGEKGVWVTQPETRDGIRPARPKPYQVLCRRRNRSLLAQKRLMLGGESARSANA